MEELLSKYNLTFKKELEDNCFLAEDNFGYRYKTSKRQLQNNIRRNVKSLDKFNLKNPYSLYNINIWIKQNKADIELVSTEYKGMTKELVWKCKKCGNIFKRSFGNVKSKSSFYCRDCALRIGSDMSRFTIQEVENTLKERGYELLSDYVNSTTKISFEDKCGYKYCMTLDDFKHCGTPYKWVKSNPYSIENIKLFIELNNLNVELLEDEYINYYEKMKFKCTCGEVYYESLSHLIYDNKTRCNKCSQKQSSISQKTEEYLIANNIVYIKEKTFNDLKSEKGQYLRYDYYLPNKNILIEVDGKQHYIHSKQGYFTKEVVEEIQKRDYIKNEYAKQSNIKLIRLKYDLFDSDLYKIKLEAILNN